MNAIEMVLREARGLVEEHGRRGLLAKVLTPLTWALERHDRVAREATRQAYQWARMSAKPREPFEAPPSRDGSLTFVPTPEQAYNDPLLAACHSAGLSESQVIELQRIQREELMRQLLRRAELTTTPTFMLSRDGVVVDSIEMPGRPR